MQFSTFNQNVEFESQYFKGKIVKGTVSALVFFFNTECPVLLPW